MGGKNGHQHLQLFVVWAHDCTKSVTKMNKHITTVIKAALEDSFGAAFVDGIKKPLFSVFYKTKPIKTKPTAQHFGL